jgi:hypothetical protein
MGLIAMLAGATAFAQQDGGVVAHLKQVSGNILVGRESGLVAGGEAAPLARGMRVITTANSEVVVVYDTGCEVALKQNQRFEIAVDKTCAALIAQVESLLPETTLTALGGFGLLGLVPEADAAFVVVEGELDQRKNHGHGAAPVSPE